LAVVTWKLFVLAAQHYMKKAMLLVFLAALMNTADVMLWLVIATALVVLSINLMFWPYMSRALNNIPARIPVTKILAVITMFFFASTFTPLLATLRTLFGITAPVPSSVAPPRPSVSTAPGSPHQGQ
jgi:hypothetical protein